MLVRCLLLPLPLASYKIFRKKLFTHSRRARTLEKQKVQFRVSFRSSWFCIVRFPQHWYYVNKDPSWKKILRISLESISLFLFRSQHNPFNLSNIPLRVLMSLFLFPLFRIFFSDSRHLFPSYPSFCPLYSLLYHSLRFQRRHQNSEVRQFSSLSWLPGSSWHEISYL